MSLTRLQLGLLCLALASLGRAARAEEVPNHPGWSLTRFESSDRVDGDGNPIPFYSLQPPGGRAAITIDSGTAASIASGAVTPESAYGTPGEKDENTFDLAAKPSSLSPLSSHGIVSGGVAASPPARRAAASESAPSPAAASNASGASSPHTPQRPQVDAPPAPNGKEGSFLHDLVVNGVPVNDGITSGGVRNIASTGGTGNGGGHPGETGPDPGNNQPSQMSGTPASDQTVTSGVSGVTYGDGSCTGGGRETVVTVVYGGATITSASYTTQHCQSVSVAIDPAKVQVVNSSTILVDGKTLHLFR